MGKRLQALIRFAVYLTGKAECFGFPWTFHLNCGSGLGCNGTVLHFCTHRFRV